VPEASQILADAPIDRIAVLDHIPPFALEPAVVEKKLTLVGASGLVAQAIRRMHEGGSLVELLGD
jgi:ribose-phosphate pyrophosphokinase